MRNTPILLLFAAMLFAACMAEQTVDRLSLAQPMRIADLPKARQAESLSQLLRRIARWVTRKFFRLQRPRVHCAPQE